MIHEASAVLHMVKPAEPEPAPLVRVKQCRHGVFCYFPHDFYLGGSLDRYGEYNEDESRLILSYVKEGDIVVEVGANIGSHTVALAKAVTNSGRVLAFEPQRVIYQMLCANLSLNALWNVIAEHSGLGAMNCIMHVPPTDYAALGNFGGVSLTDAPGEPVQVVTLDSLKLPRCDLIKVDVEGMEGEVLQGASETIAKYRPIMYVENDRKEKSSALVALLSEWNYDLYWHLPPLFSADNFCHNSVNDYGEVVSINMLCLPREKNIQCGLTPAKKVTIPVPFSINPMPHGNLNLGGMLP